MSDLTIKQDVEAKLRWEPNINAAAIGVAVKDSIVTLTGRVPTYMEKMAAAGAAARVTGVKAVANEIEVGLLPADQRSDEEIARADAGARGGRGLRAPLAASGDLVGVHPCTPRR